MTTIRDIANATQLSLSTVSRVLNGKKTTPENEEKVLNAARALNYHNLAYLEAAKGISANGDAALKRTVILIPGISGADGAFRAAQELGYNLLHVPQEGHYKEYILSLLESGAALGILLHGGVDPEFVQQCSSRFPTVMTRFGRESHTVWIDEEAASLQLTEELISHGCSRIWCFTTEATPHETLPTLLQNRLEAFGLKSEQVAFFDANSCCFRSDYEVHQPLIDQILSLPAAQRPDGLILPSSIMASSVVNLLGLHGISVPDDIAVVATIGGAYDFACKPYLTSVLPPFSELNYEAMRMLDNMICGRPGPQDIRYPHKIRYAGSTRKELAPFDTEIR